MAEFTSESWYTAQPIDASYGMITKGGIEVPCASVVFKIIEGTCKDKTIKFEVTKWETKNNIFTFRKLQTCGWKFVTPKSIREDILGAAKDGRTVRIQVRWAEFGDGFWAVDKIMPNEQAARAVKPSSGDTDALMQEMMAEAQRADEEYRVRRAGGRSDDDGYRNDAPAPVDGDLPF